MTTPSRSRKFSWKNARIPVYFALAVLVAIGLVKGIHESLTKPREGVTYVTPTPSAPSPSESWNLSLDGEAGFWEYQRSTKYSGSKKTALEAGYLVCDILSISDPLHAYNTLRFNREATETSAQQLLVSSTTYLCPQHLPSVKTFSQSGAVPWVVTFPKG